MDNDKEIKPIQDKDTEAKTEKTEDKKETVVKLPEWSIEPPLQIKRDK